jgi:light-regulated signal transduction histidine kinase (bacteriophytochrome)
MEGLPTIESAAAHESRLLSLSPDLLGAAGFDGLLKLHNASWTTVLGWSDEHLAATPFLELVEAAESAGGQEFEFCLRHADGSERCILWSAQSSPADGCFYIAGKDITERKRLEDELALRAEKLERTNAELQDFAYIASHDLAEPLRMITSYLELLKRRYEGQLDETADEFIGYAVGGAERMKALIDDLLTYSRVGSHDMQKAGVDLSDLLGHVLEGLQRAIEDAGAEVELATPLAQVCGDPTQIGQLMQNLVANAVKFADAGRPPAVTISTSEEDDGVRISVADNGIGIAEAQQERIFKMFARLHGRDEYEGTGIGLALCRRICDRHGGRIWVESVPGEGSTFHVWLPGTT